MTLHKQSNSVFRIGVTINFQVVFIGLASAPCPIKSALLVITGWLFVGWLIGNAVFSETALRIFLIICMKLRHYKGRKFTEPDFWKKFLIWRYSQRGLQISPKSDTDIFLKTAYNDFSGFWPEVNTKYDLQFEWNLFFRKICNLKIFDLES